MKLTPVIITDLQKIRDIPKNLTHAVNELQGISTFILFDGVVSDAEIESLKAWLKNYTHMLSAYPLNVLDTLLHELYEHPDTVETNRATLFEFLSALNAHNKMQPVVNDIYDTITDLPIEGKSFVITGEFVYGDREKIKSEIFRRGGEVRQMVSTFTNYLIVGDRGSNDYKFGKFGTKIQYAMDMKLVNKTGIKIITESTFVDKIVHSPSLHG